MSHTGIEDERRETLEAVQGGATIILFRQF